MFCLNFINEFKDEDSIYVLNSAHLSLSVGFCKFCKNFELKNSKIENNSISNSRDDLSYGYALDISYSNFSFENVTI